MPNLINEKKYVECLQEKFDAAALAYESRFLPKMFGWKYENSTARDSANWNFKVGLGLALVDFGYDVLYAIKSDIEYVDLPETFKPQFRQWMLDNEILRCNK